MGEKEDTSVLKKNEYGFVEDPRYKVCEREARYGIILGLVNLAVWAIAGYGLGSGPVENYSYTMGFPAWFFISCILNSLLAVGATIYIVKRKLLNMSLDRMTEEEAAAFVRKEVQKR